MLKKLSLNPSLNLYASKDFSISWIEIHVGYLWWNNFIIKSFAQSNFLFSIFQRDFSRKKLYPYIEDIKFFEVDPLDL